MYAKAAGDSCSIANAQQAGDGCLDPYFDGGCAYAKAWVEASSKGLVEAAAAAGVNITFGSGADADCACSLGGEAFATALAHELEAVPAHAVSVVEAEACTDGVLDTTLARACHAKALAELYAKVRRTSSL